MWSTVTRASLCAATPCGEPREIRALVCGFADRRLDYSAIGSKINGGPGGIRTHERLAALPIFKNGAISFSATDPRKYGWADRI